MKEKQPQCKELCNICKIYAITDCRECPNIFYNAESSIKLFLKYYKYITRSVEGFGDSPKFFALDEINLISNGIEDYVEEVGL